MWPYYFKFNKVKVGEYTTQPPLVNKVDACDFSRRQNSQHLNNRI